MFTINLGNCKSNERRRGAKCGTVNAQDTVVKNSVSGGSAPFVPPFALTMEGCMEDIEGCAAIVKTTTKET